MDEPKLAIKDDTSDNKVRRAKNAEQLKKRIAAIDSKISETHAKRQEALLEVEKIKDYTIFFIAGQILIIINLAFKPNFAGFVILFLVSIGFMAYRKFAGKNILKANAALEFDKTIRKLREEKRKHEQALKNNTGVNRR